MVASLALLLTSLLSMTMAAPVEQLSYKRALPTPIAVSTAKSYLSEPWTFEVTVAADSNSPAYSRDQFKTWDIISGTCDTRETVLKRDGTDVVTDSSCKPTSGHWVSPYDGVATDDASDLDIDHLVPLKEAWLSGARDWTAAQREAFANDLTRPQLVAVTDNLNESKGDKDIAEWLPPLQSFQCIYGRAWVQVKHYYDLTIDTAEKTALEQLLDSC
ncbi:hypothetical protein NM688_g9204 [Phlebia brevispora]|uniref:Uncharacterized protein n=1 Tax=Phlebia brevispora TaxID=194682 RepID=A0ACC1RJJ0_9APHY|nr:hypothetical protein NM688_g9204 [Phlebia brevispora]